MDLDDIVKKEKSSWFGLGRIVRGIAYTITVCALTLSLVGCSKKDEYVVVNNLPTLETIADLAGDENQTITSPTLTASDPDNDPLTYSVTSGPGFINASNEFEWTPGYSDSGLHSATITVSDNKGGADSQNIQITVNNVNRPPVLDPINNITANEGDLVKIIYSATDPDGDSLTATFTSPLDSNGEWQTGYIDSGIYNVTITIDDNHGGTDFQNVQLTVNNVNRPPVLNPITNITTWEGDQVKIIPSATDPDGDTPIFSYSAPLNSNGEWTPNYTNAGIQNVTVTVNDGNGGSDFQNVQITVKDCRLVFDTDSSGSTQVHTMDPDSNNVTQLTTTSFNYMASWSPDGSQIPFSSSRTGNFEIYLMNSDGSSQTRLTTTSALTSNYGPVFSPDGSKIAFYSDMNNSPGTYDIIVMNANGSNITSLTSSSDNTSPCYSPNGNKIAFSRFNGTDWDIVTMNSSDGSGLTSITTSTANDTNPVYSPNGLKIAFERSGDIFVINSDGSGTATNLTSSTFTEQHPFWHPNGLKISYTTNQYGNLEIGIMNASDGSNQTRITNNTFTDSRARFK
ncbi:Ig-like domain-containing protein [Nanoarchaeota archaeon]